MQRSGPSTVGELEKGIARANDPTKERARVNSFLQHIAVLIPDVATATAYGQICAELEFKGQRIPENDIWIAAVARECNMVLATGDGHYCCVTGLKVCHWTW